MEHTHVVREDSPPADVREIMLLSSEHPSCRGADGKLGMGGRGETVLRQEGRLLARKEGTTLGKVRKKRYKLSSLRSGEMPT